MHAEPGAKSVREAGSLVEFLFGARRENRKDAPLQKAATAYGTVCEKPRVRTCMHAAAGGAGAHRYVSCTVSIM